MAVAVEGGFWDFRLLSSLYCWRHPGQQPSPSVSVLSHGKVGSVRPPLDIWLVPDQETVTGMTRHHGDISRDGDLESAAKDFIRKFGITAGDDLENLSHLLGEAGGKLQGAVRAYLGS